MDPLTFHINALTSGQSEASRVLLTAECAELRMEFVCTPGYGFVSESYPDAPFKSLATLIMLERIQGWLEASYDDAWALMTALYRSDLDTLSFIEAQQQFSMRMARVIIETSQTKELVIHHSDLTPEECQKMAVIKLNPINLKVRMYQAPFA